MLLIDRKLEGTHIEIVGDTLSILTELSLLMASVQSAMGDSLNIYEAIQNPETQQFAKEWAEKIKNKGVENNAMRNASAEIQE